jgi:hypothetical protein
VKWHGSEQENRSSDRARDFVPLRRQQAAAGRVGLLRQRLAERNTENGKWQSWPQRVEEGGQEPEGGSDASLEFQGQEGCSVFQRWQAQAHIDQDGQGNQEEREVMALRKFTNITPLVRRHKLISTTPTGLTPPGRTILTFAIPSMRGLRLLRG